MNAPDNKTVIRPPKFAQVEDDDDGFPPEASKEKPQQELKPSPPALDWPRLSGMEPPERKWAVRGWFGFGHITLLVGQGGIGKTLIAQQMISALAVGKPFIGDIDGPRKCLMWACEDDHDELWRRQIGIANWCGESLASFSENLVIVPRHGCENTLASTEYGKLMYSPLLERLREQVNDLGAEVVILDNVGQLYGGGENDRHAVTAFLNTLCGYLAGKAIMLLAHPSRSAGSEFSGSSAWENVARTRLYLGANLPDKKPGSEDDQPQDNIRYLARRKANYSPKDYRKMTYANGALTPEEPGGIVESISDRNAERSIAIAMRILIEKGLHVLDSRNSPRYLPDVMLEYKLGDGHDRERLGAAMRRMIMAGQIRKTAVGKRGNRSALAGLELVEASL